MFGFARLGVPALLLFAFWIYCIFDVIMSEDSLVRNLPKGFWLMIVLFVPDIGGLAWLIVGRPERAGFRPGDPTSRPSANTFSAPDDSPDFLRTIGAPPTRDAEDRARARRLAEWEAELKRREDELKRRGGDGNATEGEGGTPPPA